MWVETRYSPWRNPPPQSRRRLRSEPVKVVAIQGVPGSAEDMRQTIDAALCHQAEWLVVDGYHFDAHYVSELQNVRPLVLIDDNGELESYSSAVAAESKRARACGNVQRNRTPRTRLLLGPRYALLRNEFTAYRDRPRKIRGAGNASFGHHGRERSQGSHAAYLSALAGLSIDDLQIRVVVGGSARNRSDVAETAAKFPSRVEMISNVANMAELMAWADLAIAGAGTTCWEMCLLGLPAILVVVAENQRFIAGHLAEMGAAVNAGPAESIDGSSLRAKRG